MNDARPHNLILTGFMGTGKTTIGRWVSLRLMMPFVDTDYAVVERTGMAIPAIFAQRGEATFRELERAVMADVLRRRDQVIATGGGTLVDAAARESTERENLVICLTAAPEAIQARIGGDTLRPLAADWMVLLEARTPAYESFTYHIDTTHISAQDAAQEVIALWQRASQ